MNKYNHHAIFQTHLFVFISIVFLFSKIPDVMAIDSESDREKIVAAKSRQFYKSNVARQSLLIAGNYDSDQNSKEYHINSRYYYRSNKQMHELYLFHDSNYANQGTSAGKHHLVKKSERYDATLSDKFMISQSNNYGVLYGRVNYDDLSSYYYDLRGAVGLGRSLFGDKVEFDTSVGYTDVKAYGSKIFLLPSVRINLRLTSKMTFTQRGYFFIDHESVDNDLRTSLKYKIGKNVSLALNHIFEQRRYADTSDKATTNQVRKYLSFGLVFDLD
jgi:hypothetical protein